MRNGKKEESSRGGRSRRVREDDPEIEAALSGEGTEGNVAFDDFLEDFYSDPDKPLKFLRARLAGEEAYNPAVDVVESKDSITLIADLPGVVERDLQVEFVEEGVVLRGRREPAPAGAGLRLRRAERPAGEFTKLVPLPQGLDVRNVSHTLHSGVLTIVLPRLGAKPSTGDVRSLKSAK